MGKHIKLSAVIITFNEEHNIKRCLESLKEVADEIIVVDSNSTDKTEEICRSYGVQFITQSWLGYSRQKNFANNLAQYEYLFSIDADEALSPELTRSLLAFKADPRYPLYEVKRLTNYCGSWIRHCGWYPDKKIRIWKKGIAEWQGEIHETLATDQNLPVSLLEGDLLHYSYYSLKGHLDQINLFTEIMASEAVSKGKRASLLQLLFSPFIKFIKSYFIQLGFLDGYAGFVVSAVSAQATFYKYLKMREMIKKHDS